MRYVRHALISLVSLFLILGLPFLMSDYGRNMLEGGTDAVTSASAILDAPSGSYVVLMNREIHTNAENLEKWRKYLTGEDDLVVIFEDVSCSVASSDTGAIDMAESFRSRLPEKQMTVYQENGTLLVSRADNMKFDMIIMSAEFYESVNASTVLNDNVEEIWISGGDV